MKILLFGATGIIGKKTIEIIEKDNNLELVGISFYDNLDQARAINSKFKNIKIFSTKKNNLNNVSSYEELILKTNPDIVVNAIIGIPGLEITLLCIKNKKNIALANKESVVMAGSFIFKMANENNVSIYPIDSEHSALMSLLLKANKKVNKIYITASGGKYYNEKGLVNPKYEEVIKHPIWNMGNKISIDSSTMVNKFFEIIEAYYYFNIQNIEALYHPQAYVHAMIQYEDNSIEANISNPDMLWSIQQAIYSFKSNKSYINEVNFENIDFSFQKIDKQKWKPIEWADNFLASKNKAIPIIVNIANDLCFELFKQNIIQYNQIILIIEKCLNKFALFKVNKLNDISILNDKIHLYIKEKQYE